MVEPANMTAVLQEKWKDVEQPANFTANYSDRQGAVRYDHERDEEGGEEEVGLPAPGRHSAHRAGKGY